ncbi:MAG TPA: Hsp20/alpha crystallin family protein [Polaromonas sp.]|uniref:Hsp20/alpha crystallin family protein n=1 Tax=Polaromonas sp. TaxID=1869339 RepID=UPI002D38F337|nr:Hsp20/alpha crystallin family protein [Polaromonas sp.]HYW57558.1 Hsp20/alpha crystallin family protein [Polaromonas sp.]
MFYSLATRPSRSIQRTASPLVSNGALDSFLNDTIGSLSGARSSHSATVEDGEQAYSLQLDVPGLAKDQLDIGIEGDVVRVASKSDAPRAVKAAWRFPLEIEASASTAKLENGVLTLTLAKKLPISNVTQLTIS